MNLSSETTAAIIGAFAGGALTIAGTLILDLKREIGERNSLRKGIRTELVEIKHRLVIVTYLIASHLGNKDRALLIWVRDHFKKYKGHYSDNKSVETMDTQLQMTDEQLKEFALQGKAADGAAINLKILELIFLDAQLGKLSLLPLEEQSDLLEIRARIRLVNQETEQAQFYYKTKFTPGITPENMERLRLNILSSYQAIADLNRQAVELIAKVTAD